MAEENEYLLYCPECGTIQKWEASETEIVGRVLECVTCGTVFMVKRLRRGQ